MNNKYFDEEKQEKALKWLKEKWPEDKRKCECCGSKKWEINEQIVTPLSFTGAINLGGTITPNIGCICANCGNTKYFNAVKIGIITEVKNG